MQAHHALFYRTDNPMLKLDGAGRVLDANNAFCLASQLTLDAIVAQSIQQLCRLDWASLTPYLDADSAPDCPLTTELAGHTYALQLYESADSQAAFWLGFHQGEQLSVDTSQQALQSLFDSSFDAIAFFSVTGYCEQANPAFTELLGFSNPALKHLHIDQLTADATGLITDTMMAQMADKGVSAVFERQVQHASGSDIPVNLRATQVIDDRQGLLGTWIILRDISNSQTQLRTLKHQQQMLEITGRLAGVGGWEYIEKSRYVSFTPEACKLLGISAEDRHKLSDMLKRFAVESSYEIQASVEVAFLLKTPFDIEVDYVGFKQPRTLRLTGRFKKEDETAYLVGAIQDISRFKSAATIDAGPAATANTQAVILHNEHKDRLTGLPNKMFLIRQFKSLIAQSTEQHFVFIEIDLKKFRRINENAGYSAGDECLIQTSRRLQAHVQSEDLVVRLGGDEFGVALVNRPAEAALTLARRLIAAIEQPIMIEGQKFQVQAAACLVTVRGEADSADILRAANDGIAQVQLDIGGVHQISLPDDQVAPDKTDTP